MGLLKPMGQGQGFAKVGLLGFTGSGKTYTAAEIAAGLHRLFKLKTPVAFADTEGGSEFVAKRIEAATKIVPVSVRTRAFVDLVKVANECVREKIGVLIVDSITHFWKEIQDSYQEQKDTSRLEFQDWAVIKRSWAEWTDLFVNAPLHIIVCGRAGFEWDFQDKDGKSELVKVGTKMKVESEFGFEPSLLVEMERLQVAEGKGRRRRLTKNFVRRATVLKDRFAEIDGQAKDNPTFDFFAPHFARLTPGAHSVVDTRSKTKHRVDRHGSSEWQREKKRKDILVDNVKEELLRVAPSTNAKDKQTKADLQEQFFGTRSWKEIESFNVQELEEGYQKLRAHLRPDEVETVTVEAYGDHVDDPARDDAGAEAAEAAKNGARRGRKKAAKKKAPSLFEDNPDQDQGDVEIEDEDRGASGIRKARERPDLSAPVVT